MNPMYRSHRKGHISGSGSPEQNGGRPARGNRSVSQIQAPLNPVQSLPDAVNEWRACPE